MLHRGRNQEDIVASSVPNSSMTGQQQTHSKGPRRRSSALRFFASASTLKSEASVNPHKAWEVDYLRSLRADRPARPGGSRPLPDRAATSIPDPYPRASSAMSFSPSCSARQADQRKIAGQERSASALSHHREQLDVPGSSDRRPLAQQPPAGVASRDFSTSTTSTNVPAIRFSGMYRESGMRWMEKQEARSLREALEDMDLRDEAKIQTAAQDEATELVMQHSQDSGMHKDRERSHNYRQHLERGAHARSQSQGFYVSPAVPSNVFALGDRSVSDNSSSNESNRDTSQESDETSVPSAEHTQTISKSPSNGGRSHILWDSPQKKAYIDLTFSKSPKTAGRRRSSGPRARNLSGGLFMNPDDKIYEEPDDAKKDIKPAGLTESKIPGPLTPKPRNAISKIQTASQPFLRSRTASAEDKNKIDRSEIHRNSPSQSRDPSYTKNGLPATPPEPSNARHRQTSEDPSATTAMEIRSDEIRAATSMRMKDRSPKLPSPTVVSARPGRPIVSFDQDWRQKDSDKPEKLPVDRPSAIPTRLRFKPHMPNYTASAPIVPTIKVPNPPSIQVNDATTTTEPPSIPSISVPDTTIPTISLPDDSSPVRPLPTPSSKPHPSRTSRPLPHHSSTTPVYTSTRHWSPSIHRATAQCAACALPIAGRIVSAASQRFHPHCFTCHHCTEPLECVAFYPEPESTRTARLERIAARLACGRHVITEEKFGETAEDDGDTSLRFYCHLDYHESFSPRCRSCKTPIETEVVIACGGSWHVGHFFCAECGDPFDAKTPFVEKDGFAWCVNCHAGRFSGKCQGCRKPIVDQGIKALGGEWHEGCFRCVVCVLSLGYDSKRGFFMLTFNH